MKDFEIVSALKIIYPKYDKYLHSHVKNPLCGITVREWGKELLRGVFGEVPSYIEDKTAPYLRKGDRHRNRRSVHCRLTDEEFSVLQQYLSEKGQTAQEFLAGKIRRTLKEWQKKNPQRQEANYGQRKVDNVILTQKGEIVNVERSSGY